MPSEKARVTTVYKVFYEVVGFVDTHVPLHLSSKKC